MNELNSFFLRFCVYFAINIFSNYNLIVLTIILRRLNVAIVFENTSRVQRWKDFFININHQLIYYFKFQFRFVAQCNVFWTKQLQYLVWSIWISLEFNILIELIKIISLDFRYKNDVVVKLAKSITWKNSMSWWLLSVRFLKSMSWFDETKICKFCFRRKRIIYQKTKYNFFYNNFIYFLKLICNLKQFVFEFRKYFRLNNVVIKKQIKSYKIVFHLKIILFLHIKNQ